MLLFIICVIDYLNRHSIFLTWYTIASVSIVITIFVFKLNKYVLYCIKCYII